MHCNLLLLASQFDQRQRPSGASIDASIVKRNEQRYLLAIMTVSIAKQSGQVAFLEVDPDQDVAGGRDGEADGPL